MVLHNLFFVVLSLAVYLAVIPPYQHRMNEAAARESALIQRVYGPEAAARTRADYRAAVAQARWSLLLVLAGVYGLAVVALEALILPQYVYRPLRLMLEADEATIREDHARELIPEDLIPGDEIGQIMRSRNLAISELRRHEEELALALERLENAKRNLADQDRLASLGLLSASVAHEINSPLAVLQGSIEKLLETVPDPAAQQRLTRMQRVTRRLERIGMSLLDFARQRRERTEPVAVRQVVAEAWELVAIDDKATAVRFANEAGDTDFVFGNADRLVQVFVNLLRNALHAVKDSGSVRVRTLRGEDGGKPWLETAVEDDGPGIPPDLLPQIFEAFVSTRLDARGTGLGLAVAEAIVEQHGGTIAAANRPEGGAVLTVRLPAAVKAKLGGKA